MWRPDEFVCWSRHPRRRRTDNPAQPHCPYMHANSCCDVILTFHLELERVYDVVGGGIRGSFGGLQPGQHQLLGTGELGAIRARS